VLVDRMFDLQLIAVVAIGGLAWGVLDVGATVPIVAVLVLLATAPIVLALLASSGRLARWLLRLSARGGVGAAATFSQDFLAACRSILRRRAWLAGLLTFLAYAVFAFQCTLLAQALDLSLSYLEMALIVAVMNLASFLPISIAGLGTREAVLWLLLQPRGYGLEDAIALSLAVLVAFYGFTCVAGTIALSLRPPPTDWRQLARGTGTDR
jgi:uncharacterized membrane protein YbhN (UPF0104 family)